MDKNNMRLSVSQLLSYKSCPAKWYFEKVEGVKPEPRGDFMLRLGKHVHDIIKDLAEVPQPVDKDKILEALTKGVPPEDDVTLSDYEKLTGLFVDTIQKYPLKKENIEIRINAKVCGVDFLGFVDMIDDRNDTIVDWKVKGSKVDNMSYDHWYQLGNYCMWLNKRTAKNVYFIIDKRKKNDRVYLDEVYYSYNDKDFNAINSISNGIINSMMITMDSKCPYPNKGFLCDGYCNFRKHCQNTYGIHKD